MSVTAAGLALLFALVCIHGVVSHVVAAVTHRIRAASMVSTREKCLSWRT
jgi:hypothetical protein